MAPTKTGLARFGYFWPPPGPNILLIVPDILDRLEVHKKAADRGARSNVKLGSLFYASAPGGQSLVQHIGCPGKRFGPNIQNNPPRAPDPNTFQGAGGYPGRH